MGLSLERDTQSQGSYYSMLDHLLVDILYHCHSCEGNYWPLDEGTEEGKDIAQVVRMNRRHADLMVAAGDSMMGRDHYMVAEEVEMP